MDSEKTYMFLCIITFLAYVLAGVMIYLSLKQYWEGKPIQKPLYSVVIQVDESGRV
jgi:hypothetical protein